MSENECCKEKLKNIFVITSSLKKHSSPMNDISSLAKTKGGVQMYKANNMGNKHMVLNYLGLIGRFSGGPRPKKSCMRERVPIKTQYELANG